MLKISNRFFHMFQHQREFLHPVKISFDFYSGDRKHRVPKILSYLIHVHPMLKGLSHEIFRPVLACMDASRPECEPLLLLKLL